MTATTKSPEERARPVEEAVCSGVLVMDLIDAALVFADTLAGLHRARKWATAEIIRPGTFDPSMAERQNYWLRVDAGIDGAIWLLINRRA